MSKFRWRRMSFPLASIFPLATDRNLLIDALRGFCFMLMTANHLPYNAFSRFSNSVYGPFSFFTSASGFVFLSGLVAGSVYGGYLTKYGHSVMTVQVWRRLRDVYIAQLCLFFLLFAGVVSHANGSSLWGLDLVTAHP